MKATKKIQIVLVILAVALIGGAAAGLLGVFDNDGGGSSGGGGGGGSSNTETVAPNDTEAVETYIPSEGNALCSHTMDDGKVVTAATCAAEGTKVFTCTKCGYTEEAKISKTNQHTYALRTYTENEHMKYCTVCNSTTYEEHTLTENILKATCTTTGSYTYSCACGYKHTQSIEPLGHLVTTWTNAGDSHGGICTRDGCGQYVTKEHAYGSEVVVAATCTAAGSKTQTCKDCGAIKSTVIPLLGHTEEYNIITDRTCTTDGVSVTTCSVCGIEIRRTTLSACHVVEFGDCVYCDYSVSDTSSCSHSYEVVGSTPATETSDGTITWSCYDCGYTYTEIVSKPASSCSHYGTWTEDYEASNWCLGVYVEVCQYCGERRTTEVPAGHYFRDGVCGKCGATE